MEKIAVEWLVEQIFNIDRKLSIEDIIKKAKKMEKQQIIKAAASAYEDMFGTDGTEYGEKYYDKITQDDK